MVEEDDKYMVGSFFLVESTREEADKFVGDDPFKKASHFVFVPPGFVEASGEIGRLSCPDGGAGSFRWPLCRTAAGRRFSQRFCCSHVLVVRRAVQYYIGRFIPRHRCTRVGVGLLECRQDAPRSRCKMEWRTMR